jgi:triosephosphate isomerase
MAIIVANWKMNGNHNFAENFIKEINEINSRNTIVACPPAALISSFRNFRHHLGAQNCFYEEKGAFTGENSPDLLKEMGCEYIIIGHSERRSIFQESDDVVFKKWHAVLRCHMIPIVCIGEKLEDRSNWKKVIAYQLNLFLNDDILANTVSCFAYEPIWSIGTGLIPSPEEIETIFAFIRDLLGDKQLLYGGSVTAKNAAQILSCKNVDGLLIGGASLKIDEFKTIAE